MPSALSLDLRTRIAAAVADGATVRSVAARFGVSPATASRLGQKSRAGTDLAPRPRGAPPPSLITGEIATWLKARLEAKRDLTVRALAAELCARGTSVTHDTIWRFVRSQGLTFKKNAGGERTGPAQSGAVPGALEGSSAPDLG